MGIKWSPGRQVPKISGFRKDPIDRFLRGTRGQFFEIDDKNPSNRVGCVVTKKSCLRKSNGYSTVSQNNVGVDPFFSKPCRKIHSIHYCAGVLPESINFAGQHLQLCAEFWPGPKTEKTVEDNPGTVNRQSDQRFFNSQGIQASNLLLWENLKI